MKNFIRKIIYKLQVKLHEKKSKDGAIYLYDNNNSDQLVVVLTGMSADYNYRRTLSECKDYDALYIKDKWAHGVSYYLYENGQNYPENHTSNLIEEIKSRKKYRKIYFVGSSKGGACSLYFGLKHHADVIYSGVGQYRLGDYLGIYHKERNPKYIEWVSGGRSREEWISILNTKMKDMVMQNKDSKTIVYLMYSKLEHTYPEHTKFLIDELDECNIKHIDLEEQFTDHWACGPYFKNLLINTFYKKEK